MKLRSGVGQLGKDLQVSWGVTVALSIGVTQVFVGYIVRCDEMGGFRCWTVLVGGGGGGAGRSQNPKRAGRTIRLL